METATMIAPTLTETNTLQPGDFLFEKPHLEFKQKKQMPDGVHYQFLNLDTNSMVQYHETYVRRYCTTAHQFNTTIQCPKVDTHWTQSQIEKENGDNILRTGDLKQKGIRTRFMEIPGQEMFTVTARTKGGKRSNAELKRLKEAQKLELQNAEYDQETLIDYLQSHQITEYYPGKLITVKGYKLQWVTQDGFMLIYDLEAGHPKKISVERIESFIHNNTKYVLK